MAAAGMIGDRVAYSEPSFADLVAAWPFSSFVVRPAGRWTLPKDRIESTVCGSGSYDGLAQISSSGSVASRGRDVGFVLAGTTGGAMPYQLFHLQEKYQLR